MSWPLASLLLLAVALAAAFAWYERSRPSSRTVAVVATLAALATLGRIAFAPLPNVKPTTDIVLVAGYVLGGPPGFAVGATAALASNIFFGQGPWTPWQMLAWGLVGLAGAALGRARQRPVPRLVMASICAAAGFGYGLVLNLSTFVTFTGQHTLAQFLAIEASAFPFDLAHAIGNVLFFLAFGPTLVRVLQRFRRRMDVRWGLAGAGAAALALVGFAAALPGSRAQAATVVPAAAVAYLAGAQNTDGGFGLSPGQPSSQLASAWVVIGLAAAGRDPDSVRRDGRDAASWIRAHLGQLDGPGDLERTILALAAARASLGDLPARLRADQEPSGSIGGQANLTAFAILAWRAAAADGVSCGGAAGHGVAEAAAWLAHQQNPGGGFSFAVRGDQGDVDDTAAVIEALRSAGSPSTGVLRRALRYVRASENRDGGFPQQPGGASNAQSTAWAIQALSALDLPAKRALAYLRARVGASGAVAYAAGETITPVWVTAEALAAFARAPLPVAVPSGAR